MSERLCDRKGLSRIGVTRPFLLHEKLSGRAAFCVKRIETWFLHFDIAWKKQELYNR